MRLSKGGLCSVQTHPDAQKSHPCQGRLAISNPPMNAVFIAGSAQMGEFFCAADMLPVSIVQDVVDSFM